MSSLTSSNLPVIHISMENLKPGTSSWLSTSKDVLLALEKYGCFIAVYDQIPLQLYNSLFGSLNELFDLPLEAKKNTLSDISFMGYLGSEVHNFVSPVYESMTFPSDPEGTQKFVKSLWPNGNNHFCETAVSYSKLVSELEQMVMTMVYERYGVKDYESQKDSTYYVLRMTKYRAPRKDEPSLGCTIHTDKNFITILQQNQVSGLEVKTKDGEWILVDFIPSSFVVMAGDVLLAWSNDRIHAAPHRVIANASKTRYSVGLFSHRKGMIQVPEELVDDEHPLRFKPFNSVDYLQYFNKNPLLKHESPIKSFCGI